jgi:mannose-6-phosphate isomerase-like protein (cupin superfamily)
VLVKVETWDEEHRGPLNVDVVRSLYTPVHHFRVQQGRHSAHTPFLSTGVARTYYVLAGQMHVNDGLSTFTIKEKQCITLPLGTYTISYPEGVEHICVLELPMQAWAHEKILYDTIFRPHLQKIDHRKV